MSTRALIRERAPSGERLQKSLPTILSARAAKGPGRMEPGLVEQFHRTSGRRSASASLGVRGILGRRSDLRRNLGGRHGLAWSLRDRHGLARSHWRRHCLGWTVSRLSDCRARSRLRVGRCRGRCRLRVGSGRCGRCRLRVGSGRGGRCRLREGSGRGGRCRLREGSCPGQSAAACRERPEQVPAACRERPVRGPAREVPAVLSQRWSGQELLLRRQPDRGNDGLSCVSSPVESIETWQQRLHRSNPCYVAPLYQSLSSLQGLTGYLGDFAVVRRTQKPWGQTGGMSADSVRRSPTMPMISSSAVATRPSRP